MGTLTPSGISLIATAKRELCMPSELQFEATGKQAWIEANNLPGPIKMCKTLLSPCTQGDKECDWIWNWVQFQERTLQCSNSLSQLL